MAPELNVRETEVVLTVRPGHRLVLRNKWHAFYAILASANGMPVDRYAVTQLRGWSDDPLMNGRDIARHLKSAKLSRLPIPPIVATRPTLDWALNRQWKVAIDAADGRIDLPSLMKRREIVDFEGCVADVFVSASAVCAIIRAQLSFYAGQLRECHATARRMAKSDYPTTLRALALFWTLRAAYRLPPDDAILDSIEPAEQELANLPQNRIVRFLCERLSLVRVLLAPSSEWPKLSKTLNESFSTPAPAIDISNWAYAGNYAALVSRRLGRLDDAEQRILPALVAAAASGDVHLQQIVLFNTGLIFSDKAKSSGLAEDLQTHYARCAVHVLRLVSVISNEHGIGKDSAQNEILIAELHVRTGDWTEALASIELARALVATSESILDSAALAHCEAQFWAASSPRSVANIQKISRLLELAEELFLQCQRNDMIELIKSQRRAWLKASK